MTDEELMADVLPWAKAHEPDVYQKALTHIGTPRQHTALVRLLERQLAAEPYWRRIVPLRILQETGIVVTLRLDEERTIRVGGARTPEMDRELTFAELMVAIPGGRPALEAMLAARTLFEAEVVT